MPKTTKQGLRLKCNHSAGVVSAFAGLSHNCLFFSNAQRRQTNGVDRGILFFFAVHSYVKTYKAFFGKLKFLVSVCKISTVSRPLTLLRRNKGDSIGCCGPFLFFNNKKNKKIGCYLKFSYDTSYTTKMNLLSFCSF